MAMDVVNKKPTQIAFEVNKSNNIHADEPVLRITIVKIYYIVQVSSATVILTCTMSAE